MTLKDLKMLKNDLTWANDTMIHQSIYFDMFVLFVTTLLTLPNLEAFATFVVLVERPQRGIMHNCHFTIFSSKGQKLINLFK